MANSNLFRAFFRSKWVRVGLIIAFTLFLLTFLQNEDSKVRGLSYVIAFDPDWDELNDFGKEDLLAAFSDELIREIAAEAEFEVRIERASSGRLLGGLTQGHYDGILMPVIQRPPNSLQNFGFSQPYFALGPVLVLPKGAPQMSPESLEGKNIGIEDDSSILTLLYRYPNLDVQLFKNFYVGLDKLATGRIDALIIDALPAYVHIDSRYLGLFQIQSPSLTKGGIKLVSRIDARGKALIETFNKHLQKMQEDGRYNELLSEWGFAGYPRPRFETVHEESVDEQEIL